MGPWVLVTLGHWDPGTLGLLDFGTLGPLPPPPDTSSYGMVWYGEGEGCQMTSEFIHEDISIMDYNGLS